MKDWHYNVPYQRNTLTNSLQFRSCPTLLLSTFSRKTAKLSHIPAGGSRSDVLRLLECVLEHRIQGNDIVGADVSNAAKDESINSTNTANLAAQHHSKSKPSQRHRIQFPTTHGGFVRVIALQETDMPPSCIQLFEKKRLFFVVNTSTLM
jgi:hypothetical protein